MHDQSRQADRLGEVKTQRLLERVGDAVERRGLGHHGDFQTLRDVPSSVAHDNCVNGMSHEGNLRALLTVINGE